MNERDRQPDLGPFAVYWNYYQELSSCKVNGGPIPFTAIHTFATIYEIEDFDEFKYLMRFIDNAISKEKDASKRSTENRDTSKDVGGRKPT